MRAWAALFAHQVGHTAKDERVAVADQPGRRHCGFPEAEAAGCRRPRGWNRAARPCQVRGPSCASCLPSGDQWARKTCKASGVSCSFSEPSMRARHRRPCASVHATHWRSREIVHAIGQARGSYSQERTPCARRHSEAARTGYRGPGRRYDVRASGERSLEANGPFVTLTGSDADLPRSRHSRRQPSRADWKTKYLAVGGPGAAAVGGLGLLHCGRTGYRGVRLPAASSHSDIVWAIGSMMVKRRSLPSGDQRSQKARPGRVAMTVEVSSLR